MSQLRASVFLLLLLWIGGAFLGQLGSTLDPDHVAARPFVFVLLAVTVMLTLAVPLLRRASGITLLVVVVGIYVIGRLTLFDVPIFGGYDTYLSLSESGMLVAGALLAQRLSRSIDQAERTVALLRLDGTSGRVRPLHRASDAVERVMAAARRHERALSLLLVEADLPDSDTSTDRVVALNLRLGNLVRHLDGSLRRQELILTAPFEGRVVLLAADTDDLGASGIRAYLQKLGPQADLRLSTSLAVFPTDGLTFQELLSCAAARLAEDNQVSDTVADRNGRRLKAG